MRVIQTLGFFFPDSSGGTEVYVDGLVRELNALGVPAVETRIAASLTGTGSKTYEYSGAPVFRYPVPLPFSSEQLRGHTPHGGFEVFRKWLIAQAADVYHQHSWVTGCGIHHLRLANQLGMRTIVTVHVPGNVCLRGTMLHNGEEVCDGHIDVKRCGECWGMNRSIPGPLARALTRVPMSLSRVAERHGRGIRAITPLATAALVEQHADRLHEMAGLADRVVAVCGWLYEALRINGIPEEKLVLCRQGIGRVDPLGSQVAGAASTGGRPFRIGFLGRWDRVKGIHVLVKAVRGLPRKLPVELFIYGLSHDGAENEYKQQVMDFAGRDPRIQFAQPLLRDAVWSAIADFDVLAVPSQWLETGPLVVLEAQAVGTPVLGSDRGGIAELVTHGLNGWLVPAADASAWTKAIARLATEKDLIAHLRKWRGPARTMADVAREMRNLYLDALDASAAA